MSPATRFTPSCLRFKAIGGGSGPQSPLGRDRPPESRQSLLGHQRGEQAQGFKHGRRAHVSSLRTVRVAHPRRAFRRADRATFFGRAPCPRSDSESHTWPVRYSGGHLAQGKLASRFAQRAFVATRRPIPTTPLEQRRPLGHPPPLQPCARSPRPTGPAAVSPFGPRQQ